MYMSLLVTFHVGTMGVSVSFLWIGTGEIATWFGHQVSHVPIPLKCHGNNPLRSSSFLRRNEFAQQPILREPQ